MPTFAVVDIETTGGNFHQDRIIEVAVVIHDGNQVLQEFSTLVNPQRGIQPFISRLTGITNKMVKKAPTFSEVAPQLYELLRDHIFVAHNVKFDYGFLKTAFKREDIRFRAPHFCTVELSRVLFPGKDSYSLGKLSRSLGIEVKDRHRAFGDAAATAILLQMLMEIDSEKVLHAALLDELDRAHVPEQLSRAKIDALPEEAGVYSFYDEEGRLLFVSKAKNIRNAVLSHFRVPLEKQQNALTAFISDMDYVITGNDLVSDMLETAAIVQHHPRFNKTLRAPNYRFGLTTEVDEQGYLSLKVARLSELGGKSALYFTTQAKGEKVISDAMARAQFSPTLKQVYTPAQYNGALEKLVKDLSYPYENCCLTEIGRSEHEKVLIWINDYRCVGYSYHKGAVDQRTWFELNGQCHKVVETPDLRRHILQYIKKRKNRLQIFPFKPEGSL